MNRIFYSVLALLFSTQIFAGEIEKLDVNVTGSNGNYSEHTDAIIVGDYNRYVDRMLDIDNFAEMGVPNIIGSKRLTKNISWIHMKVFFKDLMYYIRSDIQRSPKKTTVSFSLAPKRGSLPEQHDYLSLSGSSVVQVISGTGENTRFKVTNDSHVILKPGAMNFGVQTTMYRIARGAVKMFAN